MESNSAIMVLVPFPAQGHLNQLLHLALLLSSHGLQVHYASSSTHNLQAKLRLHGWTSTSLHSIHFHDLPLPPYPTPLPFPTSSNHFPSHLQPLFNSLSHLQPPLTSLLHSLSSPTSSHLILIYDHLMSFAAHAAASLPNVKLFKYYCVPAYYLLSSLFARQSKTMPHSSLPNTTTSFMNLIHASFDDCFTEEYIHFTDQCRAQDPGREHGVLINSSRVFDDEFIDILSRETNKKLYVIGPVNPILISGNQVDSDDDEYLRHECLEWLDKQRDESVVYVSFGSTTTLSDEQVEELAMGLEKSGQRFIWVLRDADHGGDVFADAKKTEKMQRSLPEGYEERIMGMVVRGWAPQLEILAHKAIGGFMSHCGWNSCMESLSFGVPLLAWPMHSDQPRNAMAVSEYLKVGVMVRDWEHRKEVVTSMEIVEVVKRLMVSDEGREMRKRAVALGEQIRAGVSEGGSSWEDLNSFISHITAGL